MLPLSINGAGDAMPALGEATAAMFGLLRRTAESGSREILTVAAQDEFATPSTRFEVKTLSR